MSMLKTIGFAILVISGYVIYFVLSCLVAAVGILLIIKIISLLI